jgi:hypothetical protein
MEPDDNGRLWVGSNGLSDWYFWGGSSGPQLKDNQWHQVSVTFSVSNNIAVLYVDGIEIANTSTGYQNITNSPKGWPSSHSDNITTVRIGGPAPCVFRR